MRENGENEISFVATVNEVMRIVSRNRDQEIEDNREIRKRGDLENDGDWRYRASTSEQTDLDSD